MKSMFVTLKDEKSIPIECSSGSLFHSIISLSIHQRRRSRKTTECIYYAGITFYSSVFICLPMYRVVRWSSLFTLTLPLCPWLFFVPVAVRIPVNFFTSFWILCFPIEQSQTKPLVLMWEYIFLLSLPLLNGGFSFCEYTHRAQTDYHFFLTAYL